MLGKNDEAIKALQKAVTLKPRDANAYFTLGNIYSELERYEKAIESYKKAVKIKPTFAEARYHLGVAYVELSKKSLDLARKEYNVLKKSDKDFASDLLEKIKSKK